MSDSTYEWLTAKIADLKAQLQAQAETIAELRITLSEFKDRYGHQVKLVADKDRQIAALTAEVERLKDEIATVVELRCPFCRKEAIEVTMDSHEPDCIYAEITNAKS